MYSNHPIRSLSHDVVTDGYFDTSHGVHVQFRPHHKDSKNQSFKLSFDDIIFELTELVEVRDFLTKVIDLVNQDHVQWPQ